MPRCDVCGVEVALPFRCRYCGGLFCVEHHLPEKHECPGLKRGEPAIIYPGRIPSARTRREGGIRIGTPPIPTLMDQREMFEILLATASVYLVYLSLYGWIISWDQGAFLLLMAFLTYVPHEMAHKLTAQHFGFHARYEIVKEGFLMTIIFAILPIRLKVLAPGTVKISGYGSLNARTLGPISLAGPLANIVLGLVALPPAFASSPYAKAFVNVNGWIALFNLLPFGILDGEKIIRWNVYIWLLATASSVVIAVI